MKRILHFLVLLTILSTGVKTSAQRVDMRTNDGLIIGFGGGSSFQNSDIANSSGFGADFTLGHSIYQKPNSFWGVDWRFRFLGGSNRAYDHRINLDGTYNNVDYTFFNWDLEFVLTLNRLRERTGLVLSGFAGAGANLGVVKQDLENDFGLAYDYSSINPNQDRLLVQQDLINLTDGDFETKTTSANIAPTLGAYIGYQFGKSFSLGIEHKVNYSLSENNRLFGINMDGVINSNSFFDSNHYTALVLAWRLRGGGNGTATVNTGGNTTTGYTGNKPRVNITDPSNDPHRTTEYRYTIKAKIYDVKNHNDVSFLQDGQRNMNFTFNPSTNDFTAQVNLNLGANEFRVIGKNMYGSDEDNTTIIVEKEVINQLPPPVVTITLPENDPHTTSNDFITVNAYIKHVSEKENITFNVNGRTVPFSFRNNVVSSNIQLQEGTNTVVITGVNTVGSDTDTHTIIYQKPVRILPPTVTITDPDVNPYTTNNDTHFVVAKTTQITLKNQVRVNVNGSTVRDFQFIPSAGLVRFTANLIEGRNIVEVTAQNEAGFAKDETVIIYNKPEKIVPPVVNILIPEEDPYRTYNSTEGVTANVLNVALKNNITVVVNNENTRDFTYDATNRLVKLNVNLKDGSNSVVIMATNEAGQDSDSQIIIKEEKPCPLPELTLISPTQTRFPTENQAHTGIVQTTNASSVEVLFRNEPFSAYQFNRTTGQLTIQMDLVVGENPFEVIAKNECGEDKLTVTLIYEDRKPCFAPVITLENMATSVEEEKFNFKAKFENVTASNQVKLTHNGQVVNALIGSNSVSTMLNLTEGRNTITLSATNECGSDTKTITITYTEPEVEEEPCDKPVVQFSINENDGNDATHILSGNVLNVKNKTDITLTVNGEEDNGFQFVPNTNELNTKFKLEPGTHTITVTATNECGSDTKSMVVTVEEPCEPPVINFTVTEVNRNDASHELSGTISDIKNKSDVMVTVNGKADNGFQFNPNTGELSTKFKFEPGTYNIVVKTNNNCGEDVKSHNVTVEEPCEAPIVSFTITENDGNDATHVLSGSVLNVKNKTDITLTVDSKVDNGFQYVPSTKEIDAKFKLEAGEHTITVTAKNECGSDSKTVKVNVSVEEEEEEEEEPCDIPEVDIQITENDGNDASHILSGSVLNVKNKTDITLTVDGEEDNGFQFVPNTNEISAKFKLEPGNHTVTVTATNECGSDTKSITVTIEEPCEDPKVTFTVTEVETASHTHEIRGTITNVENKQDVTVTISGASRNDFQLNGNALSMDISLSTGNHNITINAVNTCGSDSKTQNITVEEEQCGPRFNPGNSKWQFCLITPSGTYSRDDLKNNPNFTYSGSASSLYFSPIAGGGDALVNGQPYKVQSGQYYHFEGNLTVSVTSQHPGSMGNWMVCVDADNAPKSGNGANRPPSPCEDTTDPSGGNGGQGGGNSGGNNNGGGGSGNGNTSGNNGNGSNGGGNAGRGESNGDAGGASQQKTVQPEPENNIEEEKRQQEAKRQKEEAERRAAEEARKKAEAERKQREEARRKAEEARRQQEAQRQAAEEQRRKAEEQRRAAEEAKRKAEEQRKAAEEARKKAEAQKQAAEEARRKAEAQKRAAEEAKRKAEAQKRAEEARKKREEQSKRPSPPKQNETEEDEEKNDSTPKRPSPKGPGRTPRG